MDETHDVPKRKLGQTGIEVTVLGMGTWGLCDESYGKVFVEQRERTLERAVSQGIKLFDMAPVWGEDGESERAVAKAVGPRRDDMIYVTRAGLSRGDEGFVPRFDGPALRAACEASLGRLQTNRIDVWLLHEPGPGDVRAADVRDVLGELSHEKKVRAWGVATSSLATARAALESGAQVLSLPFNLLRPELVWDVASDAAARGVGILAHSVLAHGLLAGRWTARKRFAPDDHRGQRWTSDALATRVAEAADLRFLVHGPVLSLAAAAQRFALAHEAVCSAIVGPRTPGQVEACVHALTGLPYMSDEDLARVRKLSRD